jgi:predicted unusual protein kinase regulating ubiquinone biosynthesis (AarF/ABC1/UbiB family)
VKSAGPQGYFGRGFRLGKLGLSLTGSYLGYQAQNLFLGTETKNQRRHHFQQKASRRVRDELASLKGPFMKIGQILSMQRQALPDDAIAELASLQMQAPGMHPTLARAQFKSSCGKYPEDVFQEFDPDPFAAASLGQVHRAITKCGQKVAVKIQYPAIRTAIENDIKLLRSATLPGRITGHAPVSILEEMQRGFLEETDYIQEGKNIDYFRDRLAVLPYVTIPSVHWDLTTDRVLTMSFVEGEIVGKFLESKPTQAVRNLIGHRLFELYHFQLQSCQTLHADHHPGNYLFRPDGCFGLVDFGCVKRVSPEISELGRCCVNHSWRQGPEQAQRVINIIWGPQMHHAKARRMLSGLDELMGLVFPAAGANGSLVDFGQPVLLHTLFQTLRKALRDKLTNPEFAFITRAELGLYNLLHHLGAKVDTRDVWRRVLERAGTRATEAGRRQR